MKSTHVLLSTFLSIFISFEYSHAGHLFPAPECVLTPKGYYDGRMLRPVSNAIRCRAGQRMKIVTSSSTDTETQYCCCKWDETLTAVQTTQPELKFYANRCEFKDNDSMLPVRESLMVTGTDLYCFRDEKLVSFKAEINGKVQDMSCCQSIPKTTTTTTTVQPTTTLSAVLDVQSGPTTKAPDAQHPEDPQIDPESPKNQSQLITLLDSQNVVMSLMKELTKTDMDDGDDDDILQIDTTPVPHIKLRAATTQLPDVTVASECVYASATSTEPVKGYMSYDEPGVTLGCRSQQVMINLTTVNPDDGKSYKVHCCKFDPSLPKLSPVPMVLGHPCEFDDNGMLQSYSGVKPGPDLVCDSSSDLVTVTTTDLVTQTDVTLSCCKLKPVTTTTATRYTTSTTATTTSTATTTTTTSSTTTSSSNSAIPNVGAECVYLSDGTLKTNYMDYCEDNRVCRAQQFIKTVVKGGWDKCCCQFNKDLPYKNLGIKLRALECVFKPDGTIRRWSLVTSGPDLICDPGMIIKESLFYENGKDISMSCCIKDEPETTTRAVVTTTTVKPVGSTTPAPPTIPIVGAQCNYNEDKTLKTAFMESCSANIACRSKEVKLEVLVAIADNVQVKKCCCDYQKDLPAVAPSVPSIIAPKCVYDNDGYVNMWSVVENGNDLGCRSVDNLMTFDLGNENNKMSCCLKKDAVTKPTTIRTTPMTTTTTTTSFPATSTTESPTTTIQTSTTQATTSTTSSAFSRVPTNDIVYKSAALECVYHKNGSLNIDFMEWYSSTVGCRSQYIMQKVQVLSSDNNKMYTKICCEYSSSLPFDPSVPPLIAPTCYFSSRTAELARWSIELSGPDIVCNAGFYMYNATIFWNGKDTGFSCCQPVGKPIPTMKSATTTAAPSPVSTTASPAAIQPNQTAPICRYSANKSLLIDYMERCESTLICPLKHSILELKSALSNGNSVTVCCCDIQPDQPEVPPAASVTAFKCQFDVYGNINVYSVVGYAANLVCGPSDELRNFTLEISSKMQTMSCCLMRGETTVATTPRGTDAPGTTPSLPPKGPDDVKSTTTFDSTTNAPTTPYKGKRTVPPRKNIPPKRVIGPGECPDCLYPESGPVDSLQMIIQHLKIPGPTIGMCPFKTHTLRIIQPLTFMGYKEGRCCCSNDEYPLPYSFD
ncbi:mucin-5AC-like [Chironomus tepperi]|uniref:mucin-5AC-like n=1 Tax=Chironomus tepperi TaxID=113505 RepID=UPI00391F3C97